MTRRYLLPAATLLLGLQQLLQFAAAGPTVTTAPCPQLDGLKCSNLGAPPVVPCSTEGSGVEAAACRRRQRERERQRQLTSPVNSVNDCSGSAYASEGPDDKWYCGVAGACQEWVAAPGWTTVALDGNACPTVPASDSPVAVAATTSVTTQSQGGLVILTVELSRPASGRRRLHRLLEQAARAARALWGNTKSKVPANYALRLDLPSRLNATVKHVSIFPSLKPWSDKTPQVVGESLLWPRVPMGQDTKRRTKRKFKVLVRVRSGVSNVGPMTFTAIVYRLEDGVATDLQQASATIQVTPGKTLFGGK